MLPSRYHFRFILTALPSTSGSRDAILVRSVLPSYIDISFFALIRLISTTSGFLSQLRRLLPVCMCNAVISLQFATDCSIYGDIQPMHFGFVAPTIILPSTSGLHSRCCHLCSSVDYFVRHSSLICFRQHSGRCFFWTLGQEERKAAFYSFPTNEEKL